MSDPQPLDRKEVALPTGQEAASARGLLEERVRAAERSLDRDLPRPSDTSGPTSDSRAYLFEEACELYLNELNWEELTDEERVAGGALTEMVFPGLLTFVDALLRDGGATDGGDAGGGRPEVVGDFLLWLAARMVRLRSAHPTGGRAYSRTRRELSIADDLMDLVLARLYRLDDDELEAIRG